MWIPDINRSNKPKYIAIAEALESDIGSGRMKPGEKLPTHRDLADALNLNVSTITRAYSEAERRGLVSGTVGRGTFVSADASVTRELMRTEDKATGLIEMGLVLPLYEKDPDLLERIEKLQIRHRLSDYLRYTDPAGLPEHREIGAQWIARFGMEAGPDRITVTAGAQHALACTLAACFQPGDRIAVDFLTYPGLKTLAGMMHTRLTPIVMDIHGMIPEALEIACKRDAIRGIYLMPSVQNPTGILMPAERRKALVQVIEKNGLLLIEDDAYSYTAVEKLPALSTFLPDHSVYIASLSKILFAGLRSAYVAACPRIRARLAGAVLNTLWMAPTLNTAIISDCIQDGTVDAIIGHKLAEARIRRSIAEKELGLDAEPHGRQCFFLWHPLPEPWTGKAFEDKARDAGVNVFCAEKFAVGSEDVSAAVRLSLSGPESREELTAGLKKIREILRLGYWPMTGVL